MEKTRILAGILALSFVLAGCGEGGGGQQVASSPGCRMNSVTIDPQTVTHTGLSQCGAKDYAAACDEGVTKLDNDCSTQCAMYKKRAAPPLTGDDCKANPVQATSDAYADTKCEQHQDGDVKKFDISCKVAASCTCDP